MLGDKDSYLALGLALGFMVALALFIWVNGFANIGYCADGENYGACIRGWIGALSGWAAAGAAGFTVLALMRQIRVAAWQHQASMELHDLPNLMAAERAKNFVMMAVEAIKPVALSLGEKGAVADVYAFGGDDSLRMFEIARSYLDNQTFADLHQLDDGAIDVHHQRAVALLKEAKHAAFVGPMRAMTDTTPKDRFERAQEQMHIRQVIRSVNDLHQVVLEAVGRRYPNLK